MIMDLQGSFLQVYLMLNTQIRQSSYQLTLMREQEPPSQPVKFELDRKKYVLTAVCSEDAYFAIEVLDYENRVKCSYAISKEITEAILRQSSYKGWSMSQLLSYISTNYSQIFYEEEEIIIVRGEQIEIAPILEEPIEIWTGPEFSFEGKNISLSQQQQTAIIAYKVLSKIASLSTYQFFRKYKTKSIRMLIIEFIDNMDAFTFSEKAKCQIRKLFQIKDPIITQERQNLMPSIFKNERISGSTIHKQLIIFNPTITTVSIFKILMHGSDSCHFIIGSGGVGKSLSLVLFAKLAWYIQQYLLKASKQSISKTQEFVVQNQPYKLLSNFPKIYYISLSSEFFLKWTLKQIQQQTPFKLKNGQLQQIISQIKEYFFQKNIPIFFIIDQINIYTSLIRKSQQLKQEYLKNKVVEITRFLHQIRANSIDIIYSSSVNFQRSLVRTSRVIGNCQTHCFLHSKKHTLEHQLTRYQDKHFDFSYVQLLNSLLFELEIRIFKLKKLQQLQKVRCIFKKYFQYCQSHINDIKKSFLSIKPNELTPLDFYLYLKSNLDAVLQIIRSQSNPVEVIHSLLIKIRDFSRNLLVNQYSNYLNKSQSKQNRNKKRLFFEKIKMKAFKQRQEGVYKDKFTFRYSEDEYQQIEHFDCIYRQHAFVDKANRCVQIFYPPQVFLEITRKVILPQDSFRQLLEQYFQEKIQNESLFGSLLDDSLTYIMSRCKITLKFKGQQFKTIGAKSDNYFVNFQSNSKSLEYHLEPILKQLQKNLYFGAFPGKFQPQGEKNIRSSNSKIIDALIIRLHDESQKYNYQLITFDFTVGKDKYYVSRKKEKARMFFEKLEKCGKKSKKKKPKHEQEDVCQRTFQIKHFIVAKRQIINSINEKDKQKCEREQPKKQKKKRESSIQQPKERSREKYSKEDEPKQLNVDINYLPFEQFQISFSENLPFLRNQEFHFLKQKLSMKQ